MKTNTINPTGYRWNWKEKKILVYLKMVARARFVLGGC